MENQAIEMQNVRSSEASRERARARTARDNLVQAIGGLIGYDFLANERGSETEFKFTAFHGQRLSLICKAPRNTLDWMESGNLAQQYSSGARAEMRDIYAHATISRRGGLNSHTNRLSSKYSAPNIAFNPNLIEKLNSSWKTEFEGQTKEDKFKELIFHEFLHTSLGTEHSDEEESIDMAETCGNFCFHNPSRNDKVGKEIQSISGEICRGNFVTATPQYKAKMKRLKCLKKIKENSSDHSRSTLPPVGNRAGQCPSGKPELY